MENADLYFTVSTAGHVDHGKTSVLKKLTGIDTDRLKEEKQRQMTTDLGFAHIHLPAPFSKNVTFHVGFIDVPGHGKFIKNMIAGVGALDLALLVVAADEGPMPQTEQHLEILSLLGVRQILLVISKIDLVGPEKVRSTTILTQDLLARYGMEMVDTVPVSTLLDSGIDELKRAIARGLSRLPSRTNSALREMPAFLPIDRAFSMTGHGLVVTGTLVRGKISQGDTLWIEPLGTKARVRGLETFGQPIEKANPGQRLALNLAVKDHSKIVRGQSLEAQPVFATKSLLVTLKYFKTDIEKGQGPGIKSQPLRLYHGTAEISGFLSWCDRWSARVIDFEEGGAEAIRPSGAGDNEHYFLAQIVLDEPIVAEPGERFVIRYGEEGLAGGAILLKSRPRWLTRAQAHHFCHLLAAASFKEAILWFAQNAPQKMLKKSTVELFIPPATRASLVTSIVAQDKLIEVQDFLLTEECRNALQDEAVLRLSTLETSDSASARHKGVTLEQLRTAISPVPDRIIFAAIIDSLLRQGALIKEGDKLASAQAKKRWQNTATDQALLGRAEQALADYICIEIKTLAQLCHVGLSEAEQAVKDMEREGKAKLVAHEYVSSSEAIRQAHEALAQIWQDKKQIAPTDFKERLNISRKYAMALLSYFDDALITRRLTAGRVLLKMPER